MSLNRVNDRSAIASTIIRVHVSVFVDVDHARDQVADEIDPFLDVADDHFADRPRDREINETTWRRHAAKYGDDFIPATDAGWGRWRSIRRNVERDLDTRRERMHVRARCVTVPRPVRRRGRTPRRIVRAAKKSSDDGDGGEGDGDGGGREGGAL